MTTETVAAPYRVAVGEGLADVWFKTGRLMVKAAAAETAGRFSQFETDDPRGTATALHVHHREDETFYVLEGEVTLVVGEERFDLAPGDYAFAPRDVAHAYHVRSERARMLVTYSPAGLEELFVALGVPVTGGGASAEDVSRPLEETIRLFAGYGVDVVGPPPTLSER
jgi:mannose-6-phosphate isomerase-like protein (cupin superfamily)